jgi:DNA-binding XRE family transcriptional regulator
MKNDSRGYSYALVKEVQAADPNHAGVRLGLYCIEHNISVEAIAKQFDVSRHSIYSWFRGKFHPRAAQVSKIEALINGSQSGDTAV